MQNLILVTSFVNVVMWILTGIIIEPPTNISVPDPRGYSVKKVK